MLATLENFLQAILQYTFLQNALLAVVLISIISGIIGSLLVSNRIVMSVRFSQIFMIFIYRNNFVFNESYNLYVLCYLIFLINY